MSNDKRQKRPRGPTYRVRPYAITLEEFIELMERGQKERKRRQPPRRIKRKDEPCH